MPAAMRANRDFNGADDQYLAAELGIGSSSTSAPDCRPSPTCHEAAQEIAPESPGRVRRQRPDRAHPRPGLLTSSPEGRTAYIDADAARPAAILSSRS